MRDDRRVSGAARGGHGFQGFGQRPDLVHLDQDAVGNALFDALTQADDVGDEDVVADKLQPLAELAGQRPPSSPIVFSEPILDRDHRVTAGPRFPAIDELAGVERLAFALELVGPIAIELGGRRVERDRHLGAGLVTAALDRL